MLVCPIPPSPSSAQFAIKHRLPTMFTFKHYVDDRGLVSYGVVFPPMWRRTADYVARILTGAKPAHQV